MVSTSTHQTAPYGLALHTTSPELGLALSNFTENSRYQVWNLGRELSTQLHTHLADFIQPQTWIDLAFIAVAKGPGSFTSTRIGIVTARTLAQQLGIPLFAISTLAALAKAEQPQLQPEIDIAVQMPAQRGEVFAAIYRAAVTESTLSIQVPDTVLSVEAWQTKLAGWPQPYHLVKAEGGLGNSVTEVLAIAYQFWQQGQRPSWSEAMPFYGQNPPCT